MSRTMTHEEFKQIDAENRHKKPTLFSLRLPDEPASKQHLADVERDLKVSLCCSYRNFLEEFGGGDYGRTVVFSAAPLSRWYLPRKRAESVDLLGDSLLPVSDDGCGGLYVMPIENGVVQEYIKYWNQDGGLTNTDYRNIYEFVLADGF